MSLRDPLCKLPPESPAGCCGPVENTPPAPSNPDNAPGLPAIRYRIGDFTSFRRAMLDRVARLDLMPGAANPFAGWHEGANGDYQTMFVELWAYLADILTFYQERIANEAFLQTATQRDSMMRIVALAGYRPSPGSGASGLIAFTVEKGKQVNVPRGFRVSSKAQPAAEGVAAKPAAVFETEASLLARAESSEIPLSTVAPTNQFAKLANVGIFFGPLAVNPALVALTAADLYGSAGSLFAATFTPQTAIVQSQPSLAIAVASSAQARFSNIRASASATLTSASVATSLLFPFVYQPYVNNKTRTVVLKGVNTRLAVGDYLLAVENEAATGEKATAHLITRVTPDKAANTTTIAWLEPVDSVYDRSASEVAVYALRVNAGLFGNTAPAFNTLPATLTGTVNNVDGPFKDQNWDLESNAYFNVPSPGESTKDLFLDAVYDEAAGTSANPGWAVIIADGKPDQIFHVLDARSVSKTGYSITSKITRLKVRETIAATPLRTSAVLTGSELLPLQNNLPLPPKISGGTVILSGVHSQLQAGQMVIFRGPLADSPLDAPVLNAEVRTLSQAPVVDSANGITSVTLDLPLENEYSRSGSVLLANVVPVTQGETVKDEILGSGNGAELQSFRLKKSPLTYLPSTDPEGISAVASTLLVTVNGTKWTEQPSLVEALPDAQAYSVSQDSSGNTSIQFGDGFNGARPPTGKDNIHARYRKGLGTSGNVGIGAIQQLTDNLAGLQKVTNPQASNGGADAENTAGIRRNAPASLRAFGRAVSAPDYASLALAFPGVAKASAAWVTRDAALNAIANPYIQLAVATPNLIPLAQQSSFAGKLRSYLDNRRDPNVTLRIVDFVPVYIDVTVTVDVESVSPREATVAAARAALSPLPNADGSFGYFAFESRDFGESIHLSAVYAAIMAVPGVRSANISRLRPVTASSTQQVFESIFIRPTEIAIIANNPADPATGTLTVNAGEGGFADQ